MSLGREAKPPLRRRRPAWAPLKLLACSMGASVAAGDVLAQPSSRVLSSPEAPAPPGASAAETPPAPVSAAPPIVRPTIRGLAAPARTPAASTQPAPGSAAAGAETQQGAVLSPVQGPLTLDGRYLGDLSGMVDVNGEGVVEAQRLLELLEPALTAQLAERLRNAIGGQARMAMRDLTAEDFSIAFDTLSLSFVANVGSGGRARRSLTLGYREDINPRTFDQPARVSAGANISIGESYSHDTNRFAPPTGVAEFIANLGGFEGPTLTGGVVYDGGADEDEWRRLETRLTKDFFGSAIRFTAGEFGPAVDAFQGGGRILGLQVARAYGAIRPFQNVRPSGRREFVLERPSFVEVEVDGILVKRLQLEPGPYALADFPFGRGGSTIRLVVEDPTGRREVAVFDLFGGAGLLDKGIVDFAASAGVLEEDGEFNYRSRWAVSGFVQRGMLDNLTLGASAQAVEDRGQQVGALGILGSRWGLFRGSGAVSRNDRTGRSGYAAALDYLHELSVREANDLRISLSAQRFSRDFQDAFEVLAANPELWRVSAQTVYRLDAYTFNLSGATSKGRGLTRDQHSASLTLSRSFGRVGLSGAFGWRKSEGLEADYRFGLSLTVRFGSRWSANARYESDSKLKEVGFGRTASGDLGDISGNVRFADGESSRVFSGDLRYINNRFDGQLTFNRFTTKAENGSTSQVSFVRASTFVGFADGLFGIGRPAREGFVIARRHPTLRDSRLTLTDGGGRAIARTGWLGPAVAGIDRAYGVNRFELDVAPLPAGYDLGAGVINTFPGFGNGYGVTVGSDASRTVMGVLIGPDGPLSLVTGSIEPVGTQARTKVEPRPFFTNRGGRFVGDGLAPGRYRLVVGGKAVAEFEIRPEQEGVVDVGDIRAQP